MNRQHDYLMEPRDPPDAAIVELEKVLSPLRQIDVESGINRSTVVAGAIRPASIQGKSVTRFVWPTVVAAAAAILVLVVETYGKAMRPWTVAMFPAGARFTTQVPELRSVRPGDVIVTDSISSARLNVGLIGRASMEPGSRVRVVSASASQYRLALEKGVIHARIWAPPRFFLVETKNAIAVDLGCVYSLRANPDGSAWLRVESGEVELVGRYSSVRVPSGNSASILADGTSGLPIPVAANQRLVRAVTAFDRRETADAVDSILAATDSASTIVLWHLLPRVSGEERGKVFDNLAGIASVPRDVHREDVVALDARALERLRVHLAPSWTAEVVPLWKHWWRAAW